MISNWFQYGPIPASAINGSYNYILVLLSYVIAVLASYVALDLAGRLRAEKNTRTQIFWLLGGAFAMGAGIWSMHFIGMLAFIMPISMGYDLTWTIGSLIVAILASGLALYLLKNKNRPPVYMMIGGIFMGLGISTMHYMGMTGMTSHVNIHYLPGLFFLSIVIGILASEAALWLALGVSVGSLKRKFYLKVMSSLVMGVAICGMHYTGMAAAVFTHLGHETLRSELIINPYYLALVIAIITILLIGLALTASIYSQLITAIQNEKDFLNTILNSLLDGIIACDPDGRITVANNAMGKYFKLEKNSNYHELNEHFQLKLPDTEATLSINENPLSLALQGKYTSGVEYIMSFRNSVSRNIIIDGKPIINSEGNNLGGVIVIHDITDLKQTEKLKKDFVSIVSHELRTPLTSIQGSISILLSGNIEQYGEKTKNLLQIANKNTERLIHLINDILDIEKIEADKMEFPFKEINISELIQDAITEVKDVADLAQVKVEAEKSDRFVVSGNYERLMQVMVNLLLNAISHSAPNQSVAIKSTQYSNSIRISVIDQGSGIPEEFKDKIFKKFSQADTSATRNKSGAGLGLLISKAIIEKHGGMIDFQSIPNVETCFYFDLPILTLKLPALSSDKKDDNNPVSQYVKPQVKKCSQILYVEDDTSIIQLIQALMQKEVKIYPAPTLQTARELLKTKEFDLIILDLKLPDGIGTEILPAINLKTKEDIPVVVFSAYELDKKYLPLVKQALIKTQASNKKLVSILNSLLENRNS